MPITVVSDITAERGKQDAKRHREKQKEIIKERLPEIIAEESIITGKKGKLVKIPIKSIEIPHFRHGRRGKNGGNAGVGQGPGKPGDIIRRRPGGDNQPGKPGDEPGEDYIETEVEIEELIEMMLEDLGLPRLEEKEMRKVMTEAGYRISGLTKSAPWSRFDADRTMIEGMQRFEMVLTALQQETDLDELTCYDALKKADGIFEDALKILKSGQHQIDAKTVDSFPIFYEEDLRFRKVDAKTEYQSQAAILLLMDRSGSMTTEKKYFARSLIFWLVRFLKMLYEKIELCFIAHDTVAKIVDEESFFKIGESGGTNCYSAYELANSEIAVKYPTDRWNVYVCHFSDGEDFNPEHSIAEAKKLMGRKINMFGYCEITPGNGSEPTVSTLMKYFKENFMVHSWSENGLKVIAGIQDLPLLGVKMTKKEHIMEVIRQFLKKDRWTK